MKSPLACPICRKPVEGPAIARPSAFPFCSERCRLIDLGRWLSGQYQIPVVEEDRFEEDPPDRRGIND